MRPLVYATVLFVHQLASAQIYETNNNYVQTFVGSGFTGYVDGPGTQNMFNNPHAVASDSRGNLFVLDIGNLLIRKVDALGNVSTFAGGGNQQFGQATNLNLTNERAIATDPFDNVWVLLSSSLIRINTNALATNFFLGLQYPAGLCSDSLSHIYLSDSDGNRIWRLRTDSTMELFAGSGNFGGVDGNGIFCSFANPGAIVADHADNIYVWEINGYRIRRINQNRDVVTVTGGASGNADGQNPTFSLVNAMCFDGGGNLILACGNTIRKMSITTNSVTLAGMFGPSGYTNGPANVAKFNNASGVAVANGAVFVADSNNQRIRSITNNVSPQQIPASSLQIRSYAGLRINGTIGRTYQVQASSDMNNWTPIQSVILSDTNTIWFDRSEISGKRFYRALLLP